MRELQLERELFHQSGGTVPQMVGLWSSQKCQVVGNEKSTGKSIATFRSNPCQLKSTVNAPTSPTNSFKLLQLCDQLCSSKVSLNSVYFRSFHTNGAVNITFKEYPFHEQDKESLILQCGKCYHDNILSMERILLEVSF